MSQIIRIEHPRTGGQVTLAQLAAETGISKGTLHNRYRRLGKRGEALISLALRGNNGRQTGSPRARARQQFREDFAAWLGSRSGQLTTHLFRDYSRSA